MQKLLRLISKFHGLRELEVEHDTIQRTEYDFLCTFAAVVVNWSIKSSKKPT
jgi:hypothetical protein